MKIKCLTVGPVATNCYLVGDEKTGKGVIIDPAANAEAILNEAEKSGITDWQIFLTHGHFDHIGALDEVANALHADIYVANEDVELLRDSTKNVAMMFTGEDIHSDLPVKTFHDGEELTVGSMKFTVMATPGHTKGSVCFFCKKAVFTGDTIFAEGYGRTDFYGGDAPMLHMSLLKLMPELHFKTVYPGHGPMAHF